MTQHAERVSVLGKLGYTQARFWEGNQEADDSLTGFEMVHLSTIHMIKYKCLQQRTAMQL